MTLFAMPSVFVVLVHEQFKWGRAKLYQALLHGQIKTLTPPPPPPNLQSGQGTSEIELPDMLRSFATELAAAQAAEPGVKINRFSNLYMRVLLRLMGEIQQPLVVVIDDADRLDGASIAVLASLGMQLALSAEGRAPAIPCAIIMACKSMSTMTYKPLDAGSSEKSRSPLCDLSHQPSATIVTLSPLDEDSTGELVNTVLRCEDVSSELVNFIYSAAPRLRPAFLRCPRSPFSPAPPHSFITISTSASFSTYTTSSSGRVGMKLTLE